MVTTSNQVLVVEHLKVWTQVIVVAILQFVVSDYMSLILPENRSFANCQIHQSHFHWKWFEIDHELISIKFTSCKSLSSPGCLQMLKYSSLIHVSK